MNKIQQTIAPRWLWRAALAAGVLAAVPAHAVRAIDAPPPTPEAVRNTRQPALSTQADDRSSLRQGMLSAISPDRRWVYINGSWFGLVEGSTRLFRQGRSVQADALVVGQRLNFTFAGGNALRTTLGAVYVP
jgi:hypothetical protein